MISSSAPPANYRDLFRHNTMQITRSVSALSSHRCCLHKNRPWTHTHAHRHKDTHTKKTQLRNGRCLPALAFVIWNLPTHLLTNLKAIGIDQMSPGKYASGSLFQINQKNQDGSNTVCIDTSHIYHCVLLLFCVYTCGHKLIVLIHKYTHSSYKVLLICQYIPTGNIVLCILYDKMQLKSLKSFLECNLFHLDG